MMDKFNIKVFAPYVGMYYAFSDKSDYSICVHYDGHYEVINEQDAVVREGYELSFAQAMQIFEEFANK